MLYKQTVFIESKNFRFLKYGTAIIVVSLYLSYLIYFTLQVANDQPLIQITYEYLDRLSIPDIEVCGSYSDVEISKCVFTWDTWNTTTFDECSPFLQQTRFVGDTYCYLYASDKYFYGNTETNPDGPWIQNIDFYFKIKNITAITSRYLSVGTIAVQLMDPEFNPTEFDPLYKVNSTVPADMRIKQEFQLTNGFSGIQNTSTIVVFKKTTLRTILTSDILAIFGWNPDYHETSYLTSMTKYFPMHPNDSFTDTGHFSISPGSFIHEVQTEKRSYTVIGVLGLAGGSFGVIAGIYILLFGRPRINPWGIMHRFTKLKLASDIDLQNMPFVSEISPTQDFATQDFAEQVNRLEERIRGLENILKDYVFNISILKKQSKDKETV